MDDTNTRIFLQLSYIFLHTLTIVCCQHFRRTIDWPGWKEILQHQHSKYTYYFNCQANFPGPSLPLYPVHHIMKKRSRLHTVMLGSLTFGFLFLTLQTLWNHLVQKARTCFWPLQIVIFISKVVCAVCAVRIFPSFY